MAPHCVDGSCSVDDEHVRRHDTGAIRSYGRTPERVAVQDETDDESLDPLRAWRIQKEAHVVADIVVCKERDFRADRNTVNTLGYVVAREGIRVFEHGAPDRQ